MYNLIFPFALASLHVAYTKERGEGSRMLSIKNDIHKRHIFMKFHPKCS